jgi:phosphatidylserine/phosphatidylglycerophosphate/cardiolipin synthase-like enzyme
VITEPVSALRALSSRALEDLIHALRSGHLAADISTFMIQHMIPGISEGAATDLRSLLSAGLAAEHAALMLDAIAAERRSFARSAVLELVTSGPDAVGNSRDTGVVLRELFASTERRVLIVGFAVHQGREVFAVLAERMQQVPELTVRLCLDVRRAAGDMTRTDALLRRFAERFVRHEWPGPRVPALFYDPRSLASDEGPRASLHAKCVVVDGVRALIGSANLTEAAQQRNIEIGVILSGPIAEALERHFHGLIAGRHLQPLSLESWPRPAIRPHIIRSR